MKRARNKVLTRLGLTLAVLGLCATTSVAVQNTPAQAATIMHVTHSITIPGLIRHFIVVELPMNRFDAQGYINNGARIEVQCWASDPIADDPLDCPMFGEGGIGVYTGNTDPPLTADDSGVHLEILKFYEVGSVLDEDLFSEDEIYVKARWIDGDGAVLKATSGIQTCSC